MYKLKNLLKENPDGTRYKDKDLKWRHDAMPFGFYKNKAYVGYEGATHRDMEGPDDWLSRDLLKYPGRLWFKDKVITFWEFPPKNKIKSVISKIQKAAKEQEGKSLKIWNNGWKIEVVDKGGDIYNPKSKHWGYEDETPSPSSEVPSGAYITHIPIEDYEGSKKQTGKGKSHVVSPIIKKKKEVPMGLGSKKQVKGAKKGELPAAAHFRLRKGLGDGIIKLKDLLKEYIYEYKYDIYCDMDGVLTDFEKQLETYTGIKDGRQYEKKEGTEAFWSAIGQGGIKYWSEMSWMKDGKKLWSYIKGKNVKILSAPAKTLPESGSGKHMWVKKNLGSVGLILKRAREKQEFAKKNAILIDDMDKNIKQWKASGGIGILHKSVASTIKQLKDLGI